MSWSLTVAAIIERDGRFLMVEETDGVHPERVFNQPAGHVEPGETLLEAVVRETREETGLAFEPEAFLGMYQLQARNGKDYIRACFTGRVPEGATPEPQDADILACHWLTPEEIAVRPRSGFVLQCLEDYQRGVRLPLGAVSNIYRER
ncbi:MAG: hypothetical protein H6Q00_704 [Holophagaceae bacterium]|nr:hypothetical protein [Holophagaceae bacterium]